MKFVNISETDTARAHIHSGSELREHEFTATEVTAL